MFEAHIKNFDPEKFTDKGNEGSFEKIEVGGHLDMLLESHDRIIEHPEFFIGSGNNAIVYNTTIGKDDNYVTNLCIKGLWKTVYAEIKDRRFDLLPQSAKSIRKIQDYFEIIKSKKREKTKKGHVFRDQVDSETEARYSNRARMYLKREGSLVKIPDITEIIHIKRGEEDLVGDHPFSWEEDVQFLLMEKIQGITIEQLILEKNEHKGIRDKINFEEFSSELERALDILHRHGLYHNDLSNRNIMIDENGGAVLIDFGGGFNFPKGQSNGKMYDDNMIDLRKTLKWLGKALNDPDATQMELRGYLDEYDY